MNNVHKICHIFCTIFKGSSKNSDFLESPLKIVQKIWHKHYWCHFRTWHSARFYDISLLEYLESLPQYVHIDLNIFRTYRDTLLGRIMGDMI